MYIYRFLNEEDVTVYVGKTNNLQNRMSKHFSDGHLPKEAYNDINKILFINVETKANMDMLELYFINKYKPIYNQIGKTEDALTLDLSESINAEWVEYSKDVMENPMAGCQIKPIYIQTLRKSLEICSPGDAKILLSLIAFADRHTGEVKVAGKPPSNKVIGDLSGYQTTTISNSLGKLEEHGFIIREKAGMGRRLYVSETLLKRGL